jgi:L-2,4-diaminobutyric acid acetyltransferase
VIKVSQEARRIDETQPKESPAKTARDEHAGRIHCRPPRIEDAGAIHSLIQRCPPLDVNSRYCYALICHEHADTSVVAVSGPRVVGFISAYVRPSAKNTVFVWQVAVDRSARGQGLGGRMLDFVVDQVRGEGVTHLETTVSPSNAASSGMFESLARRLEARITRAPLFPAELFGSEDHEAEDLLRIGPFNSDEIGDSKS